MQLPYRRADAGADVEAATVAHVADCSHKRVGNVTHVHIVANRGSVTKDAGWSALEQCATENRDYTGFTVGILAWTVHVRESESSGLQPVQTAVHGEVNLTANLRSCVGRQWVDCNRLVDRHLIGLSVNRPTRRRKDDLASPDRPGGLEDVYGAEHVEAGVFDRILDANAHVDLSGKVADRLRCGICDDVRQLRIGHVSFNEGESAAALGVGQVGAAATQEVVEADDLVVVGDEAIDNVRTDEAGRAGHKNAHLLTIAAE